METNVEMFIHVARQNLHLLEGNDIALMKIPGGVFTLSEKREIELALNDYKIKWGTCAKISKRKISYR